MSQGTALRVSVLRVGSLVLAAVAVSPACRHRPSARADPARGGAAPAPGPTIVVDQFGYRPGDEKIAVVRSPVRGFDAGRSFTPGARYAVVRAGPHPAPVLEGAPVAWRGGAVDPSSGDRAWWFDFSAVTAPGDYYVVDEERGARSDVLRVSEGVYRDVLVQATRMLYYQRDGAAKDAAHAGAAWADAPAHLGPGQDPACRPYRGGGRRDVRGGWFDAGDQNKYTTWGASDVVTLLRAYRESPAAFSDDTGIPESANGVPDVLDETKWEMDWLVRMQDADGAVLSVVGQDGAPPPDAGGDPDTAPSRARGPCTYGPPTTAATLGAAAAFALGAIVFRSAEGDRPDGVAYAGDLAARARRAWSWAALHPAAVFANSGKIAAGEQEVDDAGRAAKKLEAAAILFELTGEAAYRDAFDAGYAKAAPAFSGALDPFDVEREEAQLEYATTPKATAAVARDVLARYAAALARDPALGDPRDDPDPYLAYLPSYTWGSNASKAKLGNLLADAAAFAADAPAASRAMRGAERYAHSLHGVNPLGLVYLSNMGAYGAERSVTRFFHTWFAHGSDWDAAGVSKYGPPPGFLVGGPNPSYAWDPCCPSRCAGRSCGAAPLSPPAGQPPQKSYRDFNDPWPLDSWSVSEPDVGYQAQYIRLLSKLVR